MTCLTVEGNWSRVFNGNSKEIIVGKNKLSRNTLLQISCNSNLQAYTTFIYVKKEIKLTLGIIAE